MKKINWNTGNRFQFWLCHVIDLIFEVLLYCHYNFLGFFFIQHLKLQVCGITNPIENLNFTLVMQVMFYPPYGLYGMKSDLKIFQ